MKSDLELVGKEGDDLWKMTEGSPECPKCGSPILVGHIREYSSDMAIVDWACEGCGHKWSACCPFEDGCLTPVEDDGSWIGLKTWVK